MRFTHFAVSFHPVLQTKPSFVCNVPVWLLRESTGQQGCHYRSSKTLILLHTPSCHTDTYTETEKPLQLNTKQLLTDTERESEKESTWRTSTSQGNYQLRCTFKDKMCEFWTTDVPKQNSKKKLMINKKYIFLFSKHSPICHWSDKWIVPPQTHATLQIFSLYTSKHS